MKEILMYESNDGLLYKEKILAERRDRHIELEREYGKIQLISISESVPFSDLVDWLKEPKHREFMKKLLETTDTEV